MYKELIEKTEAVIFDLDGTLVDSMWVWKQIDIDYFKMFGIEYDDEYQQNIEGMSFYETAQYTHKSYSQITHSVEEMMETWTDMAFNQYSNNIREKDNIIELLTYLKVKGKKIGIATSNSKTLCEEILNKRNLAGFFDVVLTGDQCGAGKPAPDVYLNVAARLEVSPEKCLVFEDLCNGIKAGINAGMTTVAVWDEYSKDSWEEKKSLADYNISAYKEIVDEICR